MYIITSMHPLVVIRVWIFMVYVLRIARQGSLFLSKYYLSLFSCIGYPAFTECDAIDLHFYHARHLPLELIIY